MKKVNTPKAQLSLSITNLQNFLWLHKKFPKYFSGYRHSKELMKIYKILIDRPKVWENKIEYEKLEPEEKLHLVFGTDYRHIYTYKAIQNFTLNVGEIKNPELIASIELIKAARDIREGDTILIRRDTRDEDLKIDLQILSGGLFQDSTEDWKVFTLDTIDLKEIRKFIKLVDDDGIKESYG